MDPESKTIKCPRCGEKGLLTTKKTVTKKGERKHIYEKLYVAHYLPNGVSKHGKPVNRIRWCYLNKEQVGALKAKGVITQNVTQTGYTRR